MKLSEIADNADAHALLARAGIVGDIAELHC